MEPAVDIPFPDRPRVEAAVRRLWGFDGFRPLQAEAIAAALAGRDSLVVLPTGGGKSLCYQAPPLVSGGTDVVVSPLIALMKDQVDGLVEVGYPAAAVHSNLTEAERRQTEEGMAAGRYRLLLVAPERLFQPGFLERLAAVGVRRFVIDEAHCISHWGHDFRPEYRQLAIVRQRFPQASLHAFTATATAQVRDDIAAQLQLRDPVVLVGRFDRPNLIYRVLPQADREAQMLEVLRRHPDEAAIVYCLSRKDTEATAALLKRHGLRAAHYHAGMDAQGRRKTQEAFAAERLDVVVATVAFGMGIDRSNVRCVLHASLPKSIEHYQQETGRAGRDGLEAECVLLYSGADVLLWESLIRKSAENAEEPEEVIAVRRKQLREMQRFASATGCRHKLLSEHFGQPYDPPECGACDVCLGEVEGLEEATVVAQKVLSCVARADQRFGVGHIADILLGADTEMVRRCRHQQLSTYGLLKSHAKKEVQSWIYQLVDQGLLDRTEGDRPVLRLNDRSWDVLRGQAPVRLARAKKQRRQKTRIEERSWEGVDRELFERLRQWRRGAAEARGVAPFLVLADSVLRELAQVRPTDKAMLSEVRGIGQRRLADFGEALIALIDAHCRRHGVPANVIGGGDRSPPATEEAAARPATAKKESSGKRGAAKEAAFELFDRRQGVAEVAAATARSPGTVTEYLLEYIAQRRPAGIDAWVDPPTYARIEEAALESRDGRLKAIFERLGGDVPYDTIRLVIGHLRVRDGDS